MPEYRHGALYVVESRSDRSDIERALRQIDRGLFLEKQVTLEGEIVWCVVAEVFGDHPPLTIFEWRDESGRPISELAMGIVDRVNRLERDPVVLAKRLRERNEALKRERDRRRDEAYETMAREMVPSIQGRRSAVLHRSQALRMARDRRRAQGDKA